MTMPDWSEGELKHLAMRWGKAPADEIARELRRQFQIPRTKRAVQVRASKLGLSGQNKLSFEDEALIVELLRAKHEAAQVVRNLSDEAIAEKFDVLPATVARLRRTMDPRGTDE